MGFAVFVIATVTAIVLIDRLALQAERRGWIYWRNSERKGAGVGVLEQVDNLLTPSSRHIVEERMNKRLTRVETANGDILDLESGTVHLRPLGSRR
ncbi:hypothetical protein ACL02S_12940 [Nocardia sp. 004]|uniref:hypothetical protein n=1 Tax=Nocardia sp. 004 TaxID=3385978 RepID=UPI0039A3C389